MPKVVSKAVQPVVTERIIGRIVQLHGERVMLDLHLAERYEVETRVLKQAVRRNLVRFPEDFMFPLTREEATLMVSQGVIPSLRSLGGTTPFAFTEAGIAMLSSVLASKKAMAVNVAIVRTFVQLRRMVKDFSLVLTTLKSLEGKYDNQFKEVYGLIHALVHPARPPRERIGIARAAAPDAAMVSRSVIPRQRTDTFRLDRSGLSHLGPGCDLRPSNSPDRSRVRAHDALPGPPYASRRPSVPGCAR